MVILNCENPKCGNLWEQPAFTHDFGKYDGMSAKCPKCGTWTGRKEKLEQFKKLTGDDNAQLIG